MNNHELSGDIQQIGLSAFLRKFSDFMAQEERRLDELNEKLEQKQEDRAERARAGELGPEWQKIQQRIDNGQTSLQAVFSGDDQSEEARILAGYSRHNISKTADEMRKAHDKGEASSAADLKWREMFTQWTDMVSFLQEEATMLSKSEEIYREADLNVSKIWSL